MSIKADAKLKVSLPDGYIARPTAPDDVEAIVKTLNATSMQLYGEKDYDEDSFRAGWTGTGFILEESSRVVLSPDGDVIAYAILCDTADRPVQIWTYGRVHPEHEGKGVGLYLRTWLEDRARQAIPRCPKGARVVYHANTRYGHRPSEQLFEKVGMKPIRYTWRMKINMDSAPPQAQLPAGIRIRTYQHPADLDAVVRMVMDVFRDYIGAEVFGSFEQEKEEWEAWIEEEKHMDFDLWFLAIDEASDEIVGVSLCLYQFGGNPNIACIDTLGVKQFWRKKGLGLALLHHSFGEFWKRGRKAIALHVDADSLTGATRLYEKAGMHVDRQMTLYEKEIRPGKELATTSVE